MAVPLEINLYTIENILRSNFFSFLSFSSSKFYLRNCETRWFMYFQNVRRSSKRTLDASLLRRLRPFSSRLFSFSFSFLPFYSILQRDSPRKFYFDFIIISLFLFKFLYFLSFSSPPPSSSDYLREVPSWSSLFVCHPQTRTYKSWTLSVFPDQSSTRSFFFRSFSLLPVQGSSDYWNDKATTSAQRC